MFILQILGSIVNHKRDEMKFFLFFISFGQPSKVSTSLDTIVVIIVIVSISSAKIVTDLHVKSPFQFSL